MPGPVPMSPPLSPQASVAPLPPLSLQALDLPLAPYICSSPDPHKPPPPPLQCKDPKATLTTLTAHTHTSLMTITLTNQTELTLALNPTPLTRRPPPNRRQIAAELFPEKTPAENVEEFMAWVVATFCSGDREVVYEGLAESIHADHDQNQGQGQGQDQDRAGQKRFRPLDWERERDGGERARRRSRREEEERRGEAGGYEYQQQQQEQHRRYTFAWQDYHYYGHDRRWTNWGDGYNYGRQYDRYYGGGVNHEDGHRYHRRNSDHGDRNHRHDHSSGVIREDTRPKANFRSEAIDTIEISQPQEATATTFFIPVAVANTTVTQPQENPTTTTTPSYFIPAAADNSILHRIPTTHEEHPTSRNARAKISYRQRNSYKDHQYQQRHRSSGSTVPDLYPPVATRSGAYARPEEYEASRGGVKREE
ncbi:uncharacterized protein H6S33_005469 [Morchella sextelata]|uniref:uncharacterized protein n=1 Tax=Morchella sextelata TaxID=1174677 RepID=UPI001D042C34|nr:uncharacterized protein H6S33_005469 [Morchella sextelata]KAH0613583.1 hypothetical protein H6S33_005469 [Morchella sextelata]